MSHLPCHAPKQPPLLIIPPFLTFTRNCRLPIIYIYIYIQTYTTPSQTRRRANSIRQDSVVSVATAYTIYHLLCLFFQMRNIIIWQQTKQLTPRQPQIPTSSAACVGILASLMSFFNANTANSDLSIGRDLLCSFPFFSYFISGSFNLVPNWSIKLFNWCSDTVVTSIRRRSLTKSATGVWVRRKIQKRNHQTRQILLHLLVETMAASMMMGRIEGWWRDWREMVFMSNWKKIH